MTIKEIAEEAGVSMMTVSNVVNNRVDRVSKKTFERVSAVLRKYNYVPNLTARSLTAKNSQIIGIIVTTYTDSDGHDMNIFTNPYVANLVGVVERELRLRGYYTMVRAVSRCEEILSLLHNWKCDGALFLEPSFDDMVDELVKVTSSPLAFFDSHLDREDIINVSVDDFRGGYLATKYILDHGHRRIAFAGDCDGRHFAIARLEGYKQALREYGVEPDEDIIFSLGLGYEQGIEAGIEIHRRPDVSAVVCAADYSAIGVLEGARRCGMKVPEELSVIGFDNLDICLNATPKLTSVAQDLQEKGRLAVDMMMRRINGEKLERSKEFIGVNIVERETVSTRPVE